MLEEAKRFSVGDFFLRVPAGNVEAYEEAFKIILASYLLRKVLQSKTESAIDLDPSRALE